MTGSHLLLPKHRIRLWVWADDFSEADARRLVRVFHETWRRIPLQGRRAILSRWRQASDGCALVRVSNDADPDVDDEDRATLGLVQAQGMQVRFHSQCARMPDKVLTELVAHELCHVAQWEEDLIDWNHWNTKRTLRAWGFSPQALTRWGRQNDTLPP